MQKRKSNIKKHTFGIRVAMIAASFGMLLTGPASNVFAANNHIVLVRMNTAKKTMYINEKYTRKAELMSAPKKDTIVYKSSNTKIATVSKSGTVTGKGEGTTTITASSKLSPSAKSSYKVKVLKKNSKNNEKLFIAHRGYSSVAPENSLPAFEEAGKKGFGAIECDIHETAKDKNGNSRFVIMHDSTLNRMCNVTGKKVYQSKLTYSAIRKKYSLKKGANVSKYSKSQLRIPTLEEYLSVCKKYNVKPIIEFKQSMGEKSVQRVYQIVKKAGLEKNAIYISRHEKSLKYLRKYSKTTAMQLVTDKADDHSIEWAEKYQAGLCLKKTAINKNSINTLTKTHKIPLNLWTIETKEELSNYEFDGVTAITSNYALWN